jgi:hypothetical protein
VCLSDKIIIIVILKEKLQHIIMSKILELIDQLRESIEKCNIKCYTFEYVNSYREFERKNYFGTSDSELLNNIMKHGKFFDLEFFRDFVIDNYELDIPDNLIGEKTVEYVLENIEDSFCELMDGIEHDIYHTFVDVEEGISDYRVGFSDPWDYIPELCDFLKNKL